MGIKDAEIVKSIVSCARCGVRREYQGSPSDEEIARFDGHRCKPSWLRRHREGMPFVAHMVLLPLWVGWGFMEPANKLWALLVGCALIVGWMYTLVPAWRYASRRWRVRSGR